jgi:hypothetical protein
MAAFAILAGVIASWALVGGPFPAPDGPAG